MPCFLFLLFVLCDGDCLIINIYVLQKKKIPATWSSGNVFVSGAGGLRFKSRAGQIGHSVVNGSPSLRHFESYTARAQ